MNKLIILFSILCLFSCNTKRNQNIEHSKVYVDIYLMDSIKNLEEVYSLEMVKDSSYRLIGDSTILVHVLTNSNHSLVYSDDGSSINYQNDSISIALRNSKQSYSSISKSETRDFIIGTNSNYCISIIVK